MSASVKVIRNFGTKSRLDALRFQIVAGEMAERIGARIKQRRLELGLNQRELADRIGIDSVDNQRISDWERAVNKPSERYLNAVADALERSVSWFYETDKRETPDLMTTVNGTNPDRLARIEKMLEAAEQQRQDLRAQIEQQNENLATQTKILEQIKAAVAGVPTSEVLSEMAAALAAFEEVAQAQAAERAQDEKRKRGTGS